MAPKSSSSKGSTSKPRKAPAAKASTSAKRSSVDDGKACAILAYFAVGIIWYFVDEKMRKNAFATFHTKQALVLIITSVVFAVAAAILAWIPFLGWIIIIAMQIAILVLWIIGLVNALNGAQTQLPVIGQFAEKLTF